MRELFTPRVLPDKARAKTQEDLRSAGAALAFGVVCAALVALRYPELAQPIQSFAELRRLLEFVTEVGGIGTGMIVAPISLAKVGLRQARYAVPYLQNKLASHVVTA